MFTYKSSKHLLDKNKSQFKLFLNLNINVGDLYQLK